MSDELMTAIAELKTAAGSRLDAVKSLAETTNTEVKNLGKVTDETKAKADEALVKHNELAARLAELEQKAARRGGDADDKPKSIGAQVAKSDEVKAFSAKGATGTIQLKAITSAANDAGDLIRPQRDPDIIALPQRPMTIRQLLNVVPIASNLAEFVRQSTRTLNAAIVAEAALKPESDLAWTPANAPVLTLAHWIHVARQAMDDAPQLQALIDGELRYGLDLAEENEIVNGPGGANRLSGLLTNSTPYADPITVASPTSIDVLRLAMLQASLAGYPATGIIMNEADWARVELTKTTDGAYLFANPTAPTGPRLWGLPVVPTTALAIDTFLVGAFNMAVTLYDRMETEVLISSEDRDNFIRNMLTVRAERRVALAVKMPAAIVRGDFGLVA